MTNMKFFEWNANSHSFQTHQALSQPYTASNLCPSVSFITFDPLWKKGLSFSTMESNDEFDPFVTVNKTFRFEVKSIEIGGTVMCRSAMISGRLFNIIIFVSKHNLIWSYL